jgi:molecular chaperone GrpE
MTGNDEPLEGTSPDKPQGNADRGQAGQARDFGVFSGDDALNQATDEIFQGGVEVPEPSEPDDVRQTLLDQVADAERRVLLGQAELANFRKRVYRDMESERKYAEEKLLGELLQIVDNMDRAIQAANAEAGESSTILEGMQMVHRQFTSVLEAHHCQKIAANGEVFDPNFHEAISQMPHADVPEGHVIDVAVEGYVLHDRVLRPSQVLVSSGPPSS